MTLKRLFALASAFVMLHGLSILIIPAHAVAVSYPFVIAAPLLAFFACSRQIRFGPATTRVHWTLMGAALLLWSSGMAIAAWEELSEHLSPKITSFADFNLFIYGVPVLLAISIPTRRDRFPLLIWLDVIQAAVTAYLIYIAFFSVSPFTHKPIQPIGITRLVLIYTVESVLLAAAAIVRFLVHRQDEETCHFYKVLSTYLGVYAISIGVLNYVALRRGGVTGYFDLFADLPFLYLAIAVALSSREIQVSRRPPDTRALLLFADNVSPVFFTAALFILCVAVLGNHYYAGIISGAIAFTVYSIRTTALQSRFIQLQQQLLDARDRLEEISLTDQLTGVANRRCFDQVLEDEWDRAVRTKHALALLMIDADYFKRLNDVHGHRHGDVCLQRIAQAMRDSLPRSGDLLARYGGEEFVVLLPTTRRMGAEAVAARMKRVVEALRIENASPTGPYSTISIGIAVAEFPTDNSEGDLIEAADRALYRAKQNGRNRVECNSLAQRMAMIC